MDTVGQNKIKKYNHNQIQDDYLADQLTLFEEYDPFTGEKIKRNPRSF